MQKPQEILDLQKILKEQDHKTNNIFTGTNNIDDIFNSGTNGNNVYLLNRLIVKVYYCIICSIKTYLKRLFSNL